MEGEQHDNDGWQRRGVVELDDRRDEYVHREDG